MKKKSAIKRIICMLLIVCCTATCFNASMVKAQAAKDITNSATFNIRALCDYFPSVCGYDLIYKMKIGQKKKYNFAKASTRRHTIFCDWIEFTIQSGKSIDPNIVSKRVFGKGTSKINTLGGQWGMAYPTIKVKKICKLSSTKYKVKANVNWEWEPGVSDNGIAGSRKIGDLRITLKKKPKSYYGYIVKSMALKKVSD